ncbi:MAG: zinc ABC transporter substrate-binding protein [Chloroflexota bacterium]
MRYALLPLLALALAACGGATAPAAGTLAVAASIYPAAYLAERVGGDAVMVTRLVPDGAEAHDYEPSPSDLRALAGASLLVLNGLGLEPWVERAQASLGADAPVSVTLAGDAASDDSHVWLDPLTVQAMTERLRVAFAAAAPEHADAFAANAAALVADLDVLHAEFTGGLASCRLRVFVTSHAAYGHLAARYGLEQQAIAGLTPEAEPSPARLAELTDMMREQGIGLVLVEPLHEGGAADVLAAEVGASLRAVHPLESVIEPERTAFGDYLGMMRDNLAALREALECA